MEWNKEQPTVSIEKISTTTIEKIAPTCRLCGQKHWPLDPSCLGKKGAKAKAREKSKAEKTARNEARARADAEKRAAILEVQTEQKIKSFAEKIARIKEETAQTISETQKKLNAETEAKTKAQAQAQAELRAKIEIEKKALTEAEARIDAEKNLKLEKKKHLSSEKKAAKTITNNQKMLTMLQQEKKEFLDKIEVEIRDRIKAEEKAKSQAKSMESAEARWNAQIQENNKKYEDKILQAQEQAKAFEKELIRLKEKNEAQIEVRVTAQAEAKQLRKFKTQAQKKVESLIQKINKIESEHAQALEEFKLKSEKAIKSERQARKEAEKKTFAEAKSRAKAEKKAKVEIKKRLRLQENIRHKAKSSTFKKVAIRKSHKQRINLTNIQKSKDGTGALLSIRARDIMQQNLIWACQEDPIQKVLTSMDSHSTDYVIIGNDGRVEGIVAKSDLLGHNCSYLRKFTSKLQQSDNDVSTQIGIKWVMAKPACKLRPNSTFATIMKSMHQSGWRALPVVDLTGKVLGLVTPYSILKIRALLKLESNPNILTPPK
ncbi:MAG: CBS domain-containing protein [Planctomycetota bacterium]|jgi:predicted transcriptional regulator